MENAYVRSAQDVLKHFNVSGHSGLSTKAVEASREKHGRNCKNSKMMMRSSSLLTSIQQYLRIHQHLYGSSFSSSSRTNS